MLQQTAFLCTNVCRLSLNDIKLFVNVIISGKEVFSVCFNRWWLIWYQISKRYICKLAMHSVQS